MCRNHLLNGQTGEPSLLTTAASPAQFEGELPFVMFIALATNQPGLSVKRNPKAMLVLLSRPLLLRPVPTRTEPRNRVRTRVHYFRHHHLSTGSC